MIHRSDLKWLAGLIAAIATTLTAQSQLLPEPWRAKLTILGLVAAAISSYRITPPDSEKRG